MSDEERCSSYPFLIYPLQEAPSGKRKRYHSESEVNDIKKDLWQWQRTPSLLQEIGQVHSSHCAPSSPYPSQPIQIPDAEIALPGGLDPGQVLVNVTWKGRGMFVMGVWIQCGSTVAALKCNSIMREVMTEKGSGEEMIQDPSGAELPLHMRITANCTVQLVSPPPFPAPPLPFALQPLPLPAFP